MKLSPAAVAAIVAKKAHGRENTGDEIAAIIRGFCENAINEELVVDWLRAVMTAGMSIKETAALTQLMADSGERLDWSDLRAPVVDKHSTGGVGDDVSLVAVPLAAACGVKVAKLSGTALGHTGGTLDKLACIPGLRTDLSTTELKAQVVSPVGCAIAAASAELAPADKKLYQLRHRSGTVASVPLITASILSKKIAGGAPDLVIDVKAGSSAFMPSYEQAQALANCVLEVGTRLKRNLRVLITDMDAPLANAIGDELELAEAVDALRLDGTSRLQEVARAVATAMLVIAGRQEEQAARDIDRAWKDGSAYERFDLMAGAQGGRLSDFRRPHSPSLEVTATTSGFIESIDGRSLGLLVAARKNAANTPVGVKLLKRRGDRVARNEPLLQAFGFRGGDARAELSAALIIGPSEIREAPPIISKLAAAAQR